MAVLPLRVREYTVHVDVSVLNARALWDGAAAALRREGGQPSADEIVELLGERDDPDAGACAQLLLTPSELPGCRVRHSSVSERRNGNGAG